MEIYRSLGAAQYLRDIPGALAGCTPFKAFDFPPGKHDDFLCGGRGFHELKRGFEDKIPEA